MKAGIIILLGLAAAGYMVMHDRELGARVREQAAGFAGRANNRAGQDGGASNSSARVAPARDYGTAEPRLPNGVRVAPPTHLSGAERENSDSSCVGPCAEALKGYDWASANQISTDDECVGTHSFEVGCKAYVSERTQTTRKRPKRETQR